MKTRFLSFGGGVQTVALLLMHEELKVDEAIFADTGNEWPETYEYMEQRVVPYAKEHGLQFTVLRQPVAIGDKAVLTLEEYCKERHMTPSRKNRWCTERFKVKRIKSYVKSVGYPRDARALIGISFDELERMHRSHSRAYEFEYPLVDRRMTRKDCLKVVLDHGWPAPHKSACFYCPYQKLESWKELYNKHPDLFKRARALEEGQQNTGYTLSNRDIPLARLASRFGEGTMKLEMFTEKEENCEEGYCMV
ncbi:MAG TPA: phosphoadenosine phosphosulfate reductase family protein [Nitrososphaerales archaeon]|nr:phosphoadenosine phosphosulfate reductase family protein [Nitrososphaerales archaeon]